MSEKRGTIYLDEEIVGRNLKKLGEANAEEVEQIKEICKGKFPKYEDGSIYINKSTNPAYPIQIGICDSSYSVESMQKFRDALTAAIDFEKEQENEQAKTE